MQRGAKGLRAFAQSRLSVGLYLCYILEENFPSQQAKGRHLSVEAKTDQAHSDFEIA